MMVDDFSLEMKDNAKFIGSILSNKSKVKIFDKARLGMFGKTLEADVSAKNSAVIMSPYWFVNHIKINLKNDAIAEVSVEEKLEGKVKNNTKLYYLGNPIKKITQEDKATITRKK